MKYYEILFVAITLHINKKQNHIYLFYIHLIIFKFLIIFILVLIIFISVLVFIKLVTHVC